jgi:hypothetical protein
MILGDCFFEMGGRGDVVIFVKKGSGEGYRM